jgi:3-deoxy-D-manno-octulosonate 8-phosphate phosphatase KdsC-like HAD superfamily phosphatase|tara:strand:+ start:315 stop:473 length:159 start_codon:yes stop_codon:yes gene_type:complete
MVSRADGLGVNMVKEMVHSQIILSTEINPVVKIRAKKLNISVIQGADDKNIV